MSLLAATAERIRLGMRLDPLRVAIAALALGPAPSPSITPFLEARQRIALEALTPNR